MTTRYIFGCKVTSTASDSVSILDPCNCSSYYTMVSIPVVGKERHVCEAGKLWNQHRNKCMSEKLVLQKELCEQVAPWERCEDITGSVRRKIKNKCIQDGFYNPSVGQTGTDAVVKHLQLSRPAQVANVELAFTSMIAGCVITLMVVAMVMAFCNYKHLRKKMPTDLLKKFSARKKSKQVVKMTVNVEEDDASVVYEDIVDEQDSLNSRHDSMSSLENVWTSRPAKPPREDPTPTPFRSGKPVVKSDRAERANPVHTSAHVVPKTIKTTSYDRETNNVPKIALRPTRPPKLKKSVGYLHPM